LGRHRITRPPRSLEEFKMDKKAKTPKKPKQPKTDKKK